MRCRLRRVWWVRSPLRALRFRVGGVVGVYRGSMDGRGVGGGGLDVAYLPWELRRLGWSLWHEDSRDDLGWLFQAGVARFCWAKLIEIPSLTAFESIIPDRMYSFLTKTNALRKWVSRVVFLFLCLCLCLSLSPSPSSSASFPSLYPSPLNYFPPPYKPPSNPSHPHSPPQPRPPLSQACPQLSKN